MLLSSSKLMLNKVVANFELFLVNGLVDLKRLRILVSYFSLKSSLEPYKFHISVFH